MEGKGNHGNHVLFLRTDALEGNARSTGPHAALLAVGEWMSYENWEEGASIFFLLVLHPPHRLIVSIKQGLSCSVQ